MTELPNDVIAPPTFEMSAEIGEIAKVLPKAQSAMKDVFKNANNPAFRSKYADLAAVVEAVVPALNENGITLMQPSSYDGEFVRVSTMLLHESGQWIRATLAVPLSKRDAHGVGSAVTYGRRFGLQAMSGVAPTDDDGNSATGRNEQGVQERPTQFRDTPGGPRMSAAEAKRQGIHERFTEDLAKIDTLEALELWERQMYPKHISRVPVSWLEPMADAVEKHRNALVEARRDEMVAA